MLPAPEIAAWNKAKRQAEIVPRFEAGRIRLMTYELDYVDLLTLCPQWYDLFVRESFKVELQTETPRILDCGANVGLASLYFKRRYPRARITAYEADPAIAQALQGNLRRNGCEDVEVVQAAVWTEDGTVEFCREGADSGTIQDFAAGVSGGTAKVPSVRLKRLLEQERIDLLKLDIEGAERVVLPDCAEALSRVPAIILDLHEFDSTRRSMPGALELLGRTGFLWNLSDLHTLPWRAPVASPSSPFPGSPMCWSVLVRAFRS